MPSPLAVGYLVALGSALANGSFCVPSKLRSVADADAHPAAFTLYCALGVLASSLAAGPPLCARLNRFWLGDDTAPQTARLMLSGWGLLAGALFTVAVGLSFAAIPRIGLATAQSVWGGVAIVSSFVWGVAALHNQVHSALLAALALAMLMLGVAGIAACEELGALLKRNWAAGGIVSDAGERSALNPSEEDSTLDVRAGDAAESASDVPAPRGTNRDRAVGLALAVCVGLAGGAILVPSAYEKQAVGLALLPSFGLGAAFAALVVAIAARVLSSQPMRWRVRETGWAGGLAGVVWNVGNVLSMAAIPRLGYGVAYPLLQCSLLIGALWGIFVFREIQSSYAIGAFFASALVLVGGAVALGAAVSA